MSIIEFKYIATYSFVAQVLQQKLLIFYLRLQIGIIPIFYYNTSVICITKNLIKHACTKNINIQHHFIKGHIVKGYVDIQFIEIGNQLIDLFIKA